MLRRWSDVEVSRQAYLYRKGTPDQKRSIVSTAAINGSKTALHLAISEQDKKDSLRRYPQRTVTIREVLREEIGSKMAQRLWTMLPRVSGAGEKIVTVRIDVSAAAPAIEHWREYGNRNSVAKSYGYPVMDHVFRLTIAPTMRLCDLQGVISFVRKGADLRTGCECWWAVSGRGYGQKIVAGYYVRGIHIKAKSLEAAQKKVQRDRDKAAADAWRRRVIQRAKKEVLSRVWVGVEDSIKAGNCKAGTDAFVKKVWQTVGAEIGAMRADCLLALAKTLGQVQYVERAINSAMVRYQ